MVNIYLLRTIFFSILLYILVGCATAKKSEDVIGEGHCSERIYRARQGNIEEKLNSISDLFVQKCYPEVISLGSEIREKNRDKYYSLLSESTEAIFYEGVMTEYTLDSHERVFLSLLISISYLKQGKLVSAEVELNRAYEESVAQIYRSGSDEVNIFLQGLMWLQISGWDKAEPFLKKIETTDGYAPHLKRFVSSLRDYQLENKKAMQVRVYTMGRMPSVRFLWFSKYQKNYTPELSVKNCLSENSIILSTNSWVNQIEHREDTQKDPVLATKRALRVPATLLYSGTVLAVGGTLTYLSAATNTEAPLYLALATIYYTYRTFVNGLAPDMRSWKNLPQAFYVQLGVSEPAENICMQKYSPDKYDMKELLKFKISRIP